jgi:hypothetical protein
VKIAADILATTQKSILVGIGNQINELDGNGLATEEAEELRKLTRSRWSALGFDKKEPETIDPENPLGL